MGPLDLTQHPPRRVRATLLGFYFLPRTIDKLRAELPGGNIGAYLNHDRGLSAYVVRRLGLDMDALRDAVAAARDDADIADWLAERIDVAAAPALNAKLDGFIVERMSAEDRHLLRERHPVMERRPELTSFLDIIDADDEASFA